MYFRKENEPSKTIIGLQLENNHTIIWNLQFRSCVLFHGINISKIQNNQY